MFGEGEFSFLPAHRHHIVQLCTSVCIMRLRSLEEKTNKQPRTELSPLIEEPPAVPPKDEGYTPRMDIERPSTAPESGSKRKRNLHEEAALDTQDGFMEAFDPDAHTPKRSRSNLRQSDASASEDPESAQPRSVRRKKGSRNLSNLNLRHAAQQQASKSLNSRESKFQEGSLTDKPSDKPPSVFMRMTRTHSGNLHEQLLEDYHDGMPDSNDNMDQRIEHEKARIPQRVAEINAEMAKKEEGKRLFHFGRHLAASFHPVALWNKIWHDTKEELTQQNLEEAERRTRLKEQAEATYAQMKQAGQFGPRPSSAMASGGSVYGNGIHTPRDSGVEIESMDKTTDHDRSVSVLSQSIASNNDATTRSGYEASDAGSKPNKGIKSRLHLKKSSISNLKNDLKRVRSEFSLGAAAGNRESSSSMSPVKADFDGSMLRTSESKQDLKKQHKLSKRVSDLESKLAQARRELDDALLEASPMPKLSGRHERFTPTGPVKRPKFVPGMLPSLPSERILMGQQTKENGEAEKNLEPNGTDEVESRNAIDLNEFNPEIGEDRDETIKARGNSRAYPTRASSLFSLDNENIEQISSADKTTDNKIQTPEPTQIEIVEVENMDPITTIKPIEAATVDSTKAEEYSSLDAKLKALEKNVKVANDASKPKKRKPTATSEDKAFKPGVDTDDDAEWEAAQTPKKKRKSAEGKNDTSPPNKRGAKGTIVKKQSPLQSKKGKRGPKATDTSSSPPSKTVTKSNVKQLYDEEEVNPATTDEVQQFSTDEQSGAEEQPSVRNSLDSQGHPLDPVYEEEEETSTVPLNDAPPKPTAKATPARYPRHAIRSGSDSPHKRSGSFQPGVEEQMMTRAAEAALRHPGRMGSRSISPLPSDGYTKTTVVEEKVTVLPGQNGVPKLPKGTNGSFESPDSPENGNEGKIRIEVTRAENTEFEWPDDVF